MRTFDPLAYDNARLRIFLFGYLQIEEKGQLPITVPGQKVTALLAYLACNPGTHSRQQLAQVFWSTTPEERLLPNLRSTLNRLPQAFKQYIQTTRDTVTFEPTTDIWIDVLAFQALANCLPEARAGLAPNFVTSPTYITTLYNSVKQLETMVRIYNGAFFTGPIIDNAPAFAEWHRTQQLQLERSAVAALRHLVYFYLQQGRYRTAIAYAEQLIALDPLDEAARCRLMLLLAYAGERGAAQQTYQSLLAMLQEEFGVPPEPATVAAYERVVASNATAPAQIATLPHLAQPLIGRTVELAGLLHLLQQGTSHLVTITGLGGMGKTYLAVEAARRLEARRDFADGVVYITLAALQSGERLPEMLRQALGLSRTDQTDLSAQICQYLVDKELLLVLDNFEHLLHLSTTTGNKDTEQPARQLVRQMLQAAPQVKILVTSRQPLSLPQEVCFVLGGLSLPPTIPPACNDSLPNESRFIIEGTAPKAIIEDGMGDGMGDAIQLFQQVALHNDTTFALTPANQAAVHRFCQLVQGMPLAITLGAAHMGFLSPQELVDECASDLDLLTTTWYDIPDRHQSLRVIVDYSWQQLDESLQRLFASLSIFPNSFTSAAAQQVAGATSAQLRRLVNQSLLVQTPQERYEIHPLLRHYAAEKMPTTTHSRQAMEQLSARHMRYYLDLLGEQLAALQGPQPFATAATIHPELPNIRQAWTYGVQQKAVFRLTKALAGFEVYCDIQGLYQEGIALIGEAIQALQPMILAQQNATADLDAGNIENWGTEQKSDDAATYVATYCRLLTSQSYFYNRLGNVDQSLQLIGSVLRYSEQLPSMQGASPSSTIGQERQRAKDALLAKVHWIWSENLLWRDDYAVAKAKADQAVALAERAADQNLLAWSLHLRGGVYFHLDQFAQATADIQQAHAISLRIDHAHNQVNHLDTLGQINYVTGKLSAAKGCLESALQISIGLGDEQTRYGIHWTLCRIALKLGDYHTAEEYALPALRFFLKIGNLREASYFYYDLGKLYNKTGLYRAAEEQLAQGARLADKIGMRSEQAHIFLEQSMTAQGRGHEEEALALLTLATEIAQELTTDDLLGDILTQCAAHWRRRGHLSQSIALYQQALATYPTIPEYLPFGAMAGLARAYQQSDDSVAATHHIQKVLTYLSADPENIHLLQNPFTTYLDCFHVLHAQQDPRAQEILSDAHTLLHHHASHIHKPAKRQVFFEHVAEHRELIELYGATPSGK